MKISTDPDDLPSESDDHGVLAEAGLDTTAIGIMGPGTAQVRVVLPQVLEESDDEVVDDELEPGDLRSGEIVIELPAHEVEQREKTRAATEESTITGEIVDDVVDAVPDRPLGEGEVIEVVIVGAETPDGASDDEQEQPEQPPVDESAGDRRPDDESPHVDDGHLEDDPAEPDPVEARREDAYVEEEPVEGAPDARAEDPVAGEAVVEDPSVEEPSVEEPSVEEPSVEEPAGVQPGATWPVVDGWRAAAAELAAEHATGRPDAHGGVEGEPAESPADAEDEPSAQDAADPQPPTTAAQRAKSYSRIWAEETAAQRVSTEIATTNTTQTTGAITMTARRLEDLGKNAERESSDLLTADRVLDPHRVARPAPEGAWSEFVYGLTGGRLNLGDSRRARARKALESRVAAPLPGETRFVPVLSRKGGVGKTTVTTLLGMALADGRDDRVIAIDANPDRGTLADRIGRRADKTVRDLVHRADEIRGFNDISSYVARDETRLDVLASDPDPRIAEAFGEDDYRRVADVAEHFYSLVLTDTGTGIIHSVMQATLAHADQLVIVTGLNLDEVRLASETITWLESNGYEQLVRHAIVVLNQQSDGAPMVRLGELEVHFGSRVRSIVHLPYDRALATGSAIVYRDLRPQTREAARDLAARVVDGLREGRTA